MSNASEAVLIKCSLIHPSPVNTRSKRLVNIDTLAESIKAQGLLQFPLLRPHPEIEGEFELVFGERRWRACSSIMESMPVIIRDLTDAEAHDITFAENLQREDNTPLEESAMVNVLLNDGKTYEEIADRHGKTIQWVARRARLANLSDKFIKVLADPESGFDRWSGAHLELVARFDKHVQDLFFDEQCPTENHIRDFSNLSLKNLKEELDKYLLKLSAAPWKLSDGDLIPEAGSCNECQKRTACQLSLFDQLEEKGKVVDQCIDRECWSKKLSSFILKKAASLRETNPDLILINNSYSYEGLLPADHVLKNSAIPQWSTSECKKSDTGARQALIIDGPGAGSTKWVRGNSGNSSNSPNGGPKPLEERREALEKRRRVKIIDTILGLLIKETKQPDLIMKKTPESLIVAVLSFGSKPLASVTDEDYSSYSFNPWAEYKKLYKRDLSTDDLLIELGLSLLPLWISALKEQMGGIANLDFSKEVCQFLSIDLNAITKQVHVTIKEPKSWALLNDDGTSKAGKEKADTAPSETDVEDFDQEESPQRKPTKKAAKKKAAKKSAKKVSGKSKRKK